MAGATTSNHTLVCGSPSTIIESEHFFFLLVLDRV